MAQIAIGDLRERVTIEQKTTVADGQLGRSTSWAALATVWAAVSPLSGVERMQAQAVGSQVSWRVTIRHRTDVTPKMRVIWTPYGAGAAKTLEILAVMMRTGRPELLDLECGEGPN